MADTTFETEIAPAARVLENKIAELYAVRGGNEPLSLAVFVGNAAQLNSSGRFTIELIPDALADELVELANNAGVSFLRRDRMFSFWYDGVAKLRSMANRIQSRIESLNEAPLQYASAEALAQRFNDMTVGASPVEAMYLLGQMVKTSFMLRKDQKDILGRRIGHIVSGLLKTIPRPVLNSERFNVEDIARVTTAFDRLAKRDAGKEANQWLYVMHDFLAAIHIPIEARAVLDTVAAQLLAGITVGADSPDRAAPSWEARVAGAKASNPGGPGDDTISFRS